MSSQAVKMDWDSTLGIELRIERRARTSESNFGLNHARSTTYVFPSQNGNSLDNRTRHGTRIGRLQERNAISQPAGPGG
jgi:hypothetical protein